MNSSLFLYTAAQTRELDRRAIEECGIPSAQLMARAGAAAFKLLRARFPRARKVAVICGPGNNGGDGYVVARLARQAGLEVLLFALGDINRASADATAARVHAEQVGVLMQPFTAQRLQHADVVVDGMLGTGLTRVVQGEWRAVIDAVNASGLPVLAIDVPSGLNSDTGVVMGSVIHAQATISFIGLKSGLFTGAGREHAGEILWDDLGIPDRAREGITPLARRLDEAELRGLIRRRARDAHKGSFGKVLVVGGGRGMQGAVRLCGSAAAYSGAGLVVLATHPDHVATDCQRSELLTYVVKSAKDLTPLLDSARVVAIGPGLSKDSWAKSLFRAVLGSKHSLIVDADALNLLALKPTKRKDWVLTPHPGEAARLLGTSVEEIQRDRFAATRKIVKRYGGVCVLKGSGTLVASEQDQTIWLCDRGNPGMAGGGSGDVLTGVIAALHAQGLDSFDAARLGVWLHASAGDAAAREQGEIGLLAGDLPPRVRFELNRLTQ